MHRSGSAPLTKEAYRAVQCVVIGAEGMISAIPGEHRFAGGIVQHPAVTGIHAVLEEQIAGDVVTGRKTCDRIGSLIVRHRRRDVLHHQIVAGIPNPQRLAFGVELGEGEISFVLQLHQPRLSHDCGRWK